jgi:putative heme-binding domain-containing protein
MSSWMIGERRSRVLILSLSILAIALGTGQQALAADPPSAAGPLLSLLKKDTTPPARIPGIAKMVCERGNEHDLAFVFSQVVGESWPVELRREAIGWLREAAATRKVVPAGDLSGLANVIEAAGDSQLRTYAAQLAGILKVSAAVTPLQAIAHDTKASEDLRAAATNALIAYGGDVAKRTVDGLLAETQPLPNRIRGVAALVSVDPERAGPAAAKVLQAATPQDDPAPLVDAFLNSKGGADRLAAAVKAAPPSTDVALLALRHMYAVGRSDPALDSVLSELAGIRGEVPKLTEAEIKAKAEQAVAQGDAARGEAVFRRADLACLRCHAVSKAGGQIGPDLSSVGVSSPVDYLVKSVFDPDAQKKEEFVTRILLTIEGQQLTGIIARRTEDKITLKTADGKLVDVAAADIDFEGEGKSLMPEGLVKFMTEQEVLDVVKFLSMLGKPQTPYEIRQTQRLQRWRVLKNAPAPVLERVPDEEILGDLVLAAKTWESAYARVNGDLPLNELVARSGQPVVYVQGELNVTAAGAAQLRLDDPSGVNVWLDDTDVTLDGDPQVELTPGLHTVTLRIDTKQRPSATVRLEILRPSGTKAQFTVVDGA